MDEWTCDACHVRAYVWFWRPEDRSEWKTCAHHAVGAFGQYLLDTDHVVARDDRAELLPAVPGEPPRALDGRVVRGGPGQ